MMMILVLRTAASLLLNCCMVRHQSIFLHSLVALLCPGRSFLLLWVNLCDVSVVTRQNGKGEETPAIYRFDTTGDNRGGWFHNSFDMCCPRVGPSTIVMEGKLFIIGAQVVSV
ncbi:hypothetical protein RHMOL_Rhmol06G0101700 [Rhododendron molle]|uniref:Uncharacterized protein n=1 Tax=Rhododendron molle TaxID=49168 RepID=A0ACC0NAY5_RHOML|nr:hypothetical protein RHMOL_Rhmol06G0101700 [Rhododendron molle]